MRADRRSLTQTERRSFIWGPPALRHAEHETVLHGHGARGAAAAGRRLPLPQAGDAEERQHVRLGAGVNFRGAYHKPSQGRKKEQRVCVDCAL